MANRPANVPALTGVRGVAAVVVLLYHLFNLRTRNHPGPIGPGYMAVDLFFILSGYVMSLTYSKDFADRFSLRAYFSFLLKRFARVWPLYALITLIVGLIVSSSGYVIYKSTIASNAALAQMLGPGLLKPAAGVSIVGAAWSISTELGAYLAFPLLVFAALRSSASKSLALAIAAFGWIIFITAMVPGDWGPLDIHHADDLYALSRCVAGFVIGMVAWRASHDPRFSSCPAWLEVLILLALIVAWMLFAVLAIYVILPVIVFLCGMRSSITARMMGGGAMVYLGEISYALYLVHDPFNELQPGVETWLINQGISSAGPISLLIFFAAPFLMASLLFRFVEKPSRRLIRSWLEHRRPPPIITEPGAP